MAKTRPPNKPSKKRAKSGLRDGSRSTWRKMNEDPAIFFDQATIFLQTGQPEAALPLAQRGLDIASAGSPAVLTGLNLIGEIYVELGEINAARQQFMQAVALDPNGEIPESEGGGAEKFLWLAQLSETGGKDSVSWFEKGVASLRRNIQSLEQNRKLDDGLAAQEQKKKLAHALCGVVEIYMTDLSWEEDAEARCEALVTEALLVAPDSPECLQTLASVRISQLRQDDARAALSRSLQLWKDLPPESPSVPDFPTRISLARLLMEVRMEIEALEVLEIMALEDDHSVEMWYLGGWCQYLLGKGEKLPANKYGLSESELRQATLRSSRSWLKQSLKLYELVEYEDLKLKEHAEELVQDLQNQLGEDDDDSDDGEDVDGEWEDESDGLDDDIDSGKDKDQKMTDS
ncbi:TPR domain-containing protein [Histoplasma capsulatum var. duboisii H88]|uniref:TPR domain-containing protein n=2 Tax=Ajellomyces capsulatus TaxID=5037 RepID=F0UBP1_AJEC8|nr:TPR domain-containing protein [Histoplasma capsulatum H143]EGC43097.1 TPR domain-containing protein [Histoplasma capsulatum var. duboisii H88]QSS49280.1 TPR domain-containing protein [Histoplasma capsulatum var. duboisii H88]